LRIITATAVPWVGLRSRSITTASGGVGAQLADDGAGPLFRCSGVKAERLQPLDALGGLAVVPVDEEDPGHDPPIVAGDRRPVGRLLLIRLRDKASLGS
jgi:hypothetical protein